MLIWGSTGKEVRLGTGQFYCPGCDSAQPYQHLRVARYFTLYFIPLFQTENLGEYVRCERCQAVFNPEVLSYVPPTDAERWIYSIRSDLGSGTPFEFARQKLINAGMDEATADQYLTAAAGGDWKTCPACRLSFVAGTTRCSSCGQAL